MTKRGATIRKPPAARKPRAARKRAPARKPAPAQVNLKKKNAALRRELREALDRQAATSDVLKAISRSTFDLQTVLDTLTETAARLCDADMAAIARQDEAGFYQATNYNFPPDWVEYSSVFRTFPGRGSISGRALLERKAVQVADVTSDPEYTYRDQQKKSSYRTFLAVPLLRDGQPIVLLNLARKTVRPFTDKQIELVSSFADQAVIAIENVRLFDEVQARTEDLSESLQQQTATANVLKVISRSTFDLQTVLQTLVESAARLCEADLANIWRPRGAAYRLAAAFGIPGKDKERTQNKQYLEGIDLEPGRGSIVGRALLERKTVQIEDVQTDPDYNLTKLISIGDYRTVLGVPLLREGVPIGVIALMRCTVQPFTEKQIELVTTFADQAVIAIENVRLFDEVQARTEDLRESLQQQTATADVLKVISRSTFDLRTVLETLTESAARLCDAEKANIIQRDGQLYRLSANYGFSSELEEYLKQYPLRPGRGTIIGRAFLEGRTIHMPDVLADPEYTAHEYQSRGDWRSCLGVPLSRGGETIGVFFLTRSDVRPFTEKQIDLVSTFADQAVIAIENARLFDEVRARTEDLSESLQQQTATADVLKVISRSAFDLQTVLDTLVESAARLCGASNAFVYRRDGEIYRLASTFGFSPEYKEYMMARPIAPGRGTLIGRTTLEGKVVQIPDAKSDPEYTWSGSQQRGGYRTMLGVPLLREGIPIGVLSLTRAEVRVFTERQIELLTSFADQAVIAIENVRLFDEVQARTEDLRESLQQQTATADVLKVISRSTFDLRTVLQTLVESAAHLCEADKATITRQKDGVFFRAESYGFSQEFMDFVRDVPVQPEHGSATARALLEGVTVHIADVKADPSYTFTEAQRLGDFRTILGVPMMREKTAIGVLTLTRSEVRPFTDKQIELVRTFADQAAIAIENVRLFESVEARTRELAASLENLRAAQDRLVQTEKLASLGQLTAGIAHEIKNPLNFVNNFSTLSVELIDELGEVLGNTNIPDIAKTEIGELTTLLRDNLDKISQHGKRADSIVKNMLLHSREGSRERRTVDLNALVEESLNLAYHGARAERQQFDIRLERSFDPAAGEIELLPQEITRVLLNLISNGVYAAMKRRAEVALDGYEPTLAAATRNLGDSVEIRIRDNGCGISPEVKDKIFNPFFTTKPPGEGTGLGLSLSYDIVVKQHAGSIEVDTRPGEFTEFRVILPRAAAPGRVAPGWDTDSTS